MCVLLVVEEFSVSCEQRPHAEEGQLSPWPQRREESMVQRIQFVSEA